MTEDERIDKERSDKVAAFMKVLLDELGHDIIARIQLVVTFKDGFEAVAMIARESDFEALKTVAQKNPKNN
jgi:hypothetical protein